MSFKVTLEPSGHSFEVSAEQKILDAGLEAGLSMPFSCRVGMCRACRGIIAEGVVDFGDVHPSYFSQADRDRGLAFLCQARARSDLRIQVKELDGLAGVTVRKVPCRVSRIERPAPDVSILHLRLPLNENMKFVAGQHIEFLFPDEIRRSYSIATKPEVAGVIAIELHIRHLPGGWFAETVLAKLKERDLLKFEGPLGSFSLRDDTAKPIVMLAGGTGFAPLKAMCEWAFERGINKRRPITLFWGARTRQDLYLADLPQAWAQAHPDFTYVPVLSEPTQACAWEGRQGLVHRVAMDMIGDMSGAEVYVCGAPAMVEAARRDFAENGLPEDAFFADSFLTQADLAEKVDG